jgi:hypothetical protein
VAHYIEIICISPKVQIRNEYRKFFSGLRYTELLKQPCSKSSPNFAAKACRFYKNLNALCNHQSRFL